MTISVMVAHLVPNNTTKLKVTEIDYDKQTEANNVVREFIVGPGTLNTTYIWKGRRLIIEEIDG